MAITAAELIAIVAVRGADEAALKLAAVGGAVDSAGAKFAMLATGAIVLAGAALAGVGVASVKMAGDFQQGITRLKTGAGDATDNLAKLGQGILQVSTATGTLTNGTDGLNAAMYLIISSGQRGAMALNTLKMAAEGAKIEQAKVVDVAQILSVLMTNFGRTTHTAAQYMDGLIAAVAHGQISLENLSTAMSPILPNAKELGIHFADVAAAMSEMTNKGIPADQAATALRFTMQSMILPTKGSQKAMIEWGLDTAKVAKEMKVSLPGAIQMYIDAAKRAGPEGSKPFIDALSQMMGGGQRSAKALFALSQAMGEWKTIIGQVNAALGDMSKNVSGWDAVQGNFNLQLDRGKAALAALAISIGQQLLPYVTQLVQYLIPLITRFTDWVVQNNVVEKSLLAVGTAIQNTITFIKNMIAVGTSVIQFFQQNQLAADALGVAIGMLGGVMTLFAASSMANMILSLLEYGLSILTAVAETVTGAAVMSSTFATMSGMIITSMGAAAASILATLGPFILAGAVIAAVAIGVVLAVQHWGEISAWLQSTWSTVLSWFTGALQNIGGVIQSVVAWFIQWKMAILEPAGVILAFFVPALIIAGTQAAIAGARIAATFIVSMAQTAVQAVITGSTIFATFVASMIDAGIAAAVSAGRLAIFLAGMIATGFAALLSGARIAVSFVAGVVASGASAWVAAAQFLPLIGAYIATGAQAAIAGAIVAGRFVVTLIASAVQAGVTAFALTGSLIPALYAVGVAFYAALGPIGLVLGAVALAIAAFAAMKHQSDVMQLGVSGAFDTMGNKVQRSTGRIIQSADSMNSGVSNSANTMKNNVDGSFNTMQSQGIADIQSLTSDAITMFANMGTQVGIDMANMSSQAIGYWNNVAGYIANHPISGSVQISGGPIQHMASGSDSAPGGMTLIGEEGPEIMYIPKGAQVIPNDKLRSMGGGGGQAGPTNVQVDVYLDGTRMTGQLMPKIVQQIRNATGAKF